MGVLYINSVEIDTAEDIAFPITYSIADLKEPNKRARNRTKTIVLPDTKNNRMFFSSAYQISLSDIDNTAGVGFEFNHLLKYPARYVSNGVDIFNGVCNLLSATIENGVLSIEVNLFSDIVNIFDTWGDLKVAELGWSEYDHTLSKLAVTDSWTNTSTSGYVYGLIYFGYNANQLIYKTNDLAPYVFKREIIKKALEFLGLGLSSTTLNDPTFKRLMWGYGGGEKISITALEATDRYVFVDSDVSGSTAFSPVLIDDDGTNRTTRFTSMVQADINLSNVNSFTINNNNLSQVDLSNTDWTGSWTVANTGMYKLSFNGSAIFSAAWTGGDPALYISALNYYWTFSIEVNGSVISNYIIDSVNAIAQVSFTSTVQAEVDTLLTAGDVVSFSYKMETRNSTIVTDNLPFNTLVTSVIDMDFNPTSVFDFKMESIDKELQDGDTVSIARWIPDIKVSDFFADLIKTENLYISEPKDNQIKMESFNNYFEGDFQDWTDKLDLSKKIIFEPPRILGKDYKWKFAQDRDFFKQDYFNEYGQDYGDYTLSIAGSYKEGDKVWQTKFAQSVPVDIAPNNSGTLIVPVIAKSDNNGATFQPYKGKARVFYYNGLQTCYPWEFRDSLNANTTLQTSYPQFHHLNNVTTPTFDYNFGKPEKVYYSAPAYTGKNLIQERYFTFIRSVISKEAKVMKAYFDLNEDDLFDNFMQDFAMVNCVPFIKNIVHDYNDNSLGTTMVELFKVVDARKANTDLVSNPPPPSYSPTQTFEDGVGASINSGMVQAIMPATPTQLLNNENELQDSFFPSGITKVYDSVTNSFDFSQLEIGSVLEIIIFADVSATAETELHSYVLIAEGTEFEKEIPITVSENYIKTNHVPPRPVTLIAIIIVDEVIKQYKGKIMIEGSKAFTIQSTTYQYLIKSIGTWKR